MRSELIPNWRVLAFIARMGNLWPGLPDTRLPAIVTETKTSLGAGYIDITVPVSRNGDQVGFVLLRAVTEPEERRVARYAGLILLVTMGALVIAVLSFSQAALSRRAQQLANVNRRLQQEMEERRKTEEALRQSHKMEAIGHLSGGIAHDFNNLIMIVKGNLRLLKREAGSGSRARQCLHCFCRRGTGPSRPSHPTHSRLLPPPATDPTASQSQYTRARSLRTYSRHSVGEKVEITMRLNASWSTLCDINQMENVLLNLAINARDAMADGGRLVVETRDVAITLPPPDVEGEFVPGDYVSLAVIDTGQGMPEEVRQRAVDPFFTTKPQGKGTGLGLSMTFGFVRQSRGYLAIELALGKGTSVIILMPRVQEAV